MIHTVKQYILDDHLIIILGSNIVEAVQIIIINIVIEMQLCRVHVSLNNSSG